MSQLKRVFIGDILMTKCMKYLKSTSYVSYKCCSVKIIFSSFRIVELVKREHAVSTMLISCLWWIQETSWNKVIDQTNDTTYILYVTTSEEGIWKMVTIVTNCSLSVTCDAPIKMALLRRRRGYHHVWTYIDSLKNDNYTITM